MAEQNHTQTMATLKDAVQQLNSTKIRLEERYNSEKDRLEKLIKVITDKGYDYKNISTIRKTKEEELDKKLKELDTQIQETQQKLNAIESGV
jgi:hypothetical protein